MFSLGFNRVFRKELSMSSREITLHLAPIRNTLHLLMIHMLLLGMVHTVPGFHTL